jgi:hypothetical protein
MEWRPVTWTAVGGIVAVGIPDERRVVVGSHSGVEVFDATTGERLARVSSDGYAWLNEDRLAIRLPGPRGGIELIASMGLHGGTLPTTTADGWECHRSEHGATLSRGDNETMTVADHRRWLDLPAGVDEGFRACGFSPGGSVFVLATSPCLSMLRRDLQAGQR